MEEEKPRKEPEISPDTDPPPPPPRTGNGRRRAGIILMLLVVVGVVSGFWLWCKSKTHVMTDNAFIESHIYSISARVPGTVAQVPVIDNQPVKIGDLLVEMDANDYRTRMQNATAQLDVARNETSGNYAQVDAARAALNSDKAKLEQAEMDLARGKALFKKEVIPKEQLDRLETARKIAAAKLIETEGSVRRALAILGLTGAGGKDAQIDRKKAELEESRLNLSYTRIYAPADGNITRKSVEPGNNIQAGQPLMALVALNEAWITANYKERQLTHLAPGQKVEFKVDAFPGRKFTGVVDSIMAGTGAAFSLLPPENATGNYVKVVQRIPVKILINKESDPQHLLRVGMSVVPSILTGLKLGDILKELNPF
ncbi:MAG TPA: HlyD family secretion protein [Geobacteraceae bacterium]|nr:HlyD family secretion protein [Geobacteraceae bacterium]